MLATRHQDRTTGRPPTDRTPKEVEALYQKRSAIETAFRTMREARAQTSTTDPAVRLLFILVSFLLRNSEGLFDGAYSPRCDAAGEHYPPTS